jgi:hypothetical protein
MSKTERKSSKQNRSGNPKETIGGWQKGYIYMRGCFVTFVAIFGVIIFGTLTLGTMIANPLIPLILLPLAIIAVVWGIRKARQ